MRKHWYLILTIAWIAFWVLDIFFIIPQSPIAEMRLFITDDLAFSVYWLWITAPISLYLTLVGSVRLIRWLVRKWTKATKSGAGIAR